MAEAKATIPEFALHVRIDMEACWALRDDLKAAQIEPDAPLPSFNDLIIKACATALRRHPRANASYNEGELELHPRVNVGFAVATPDSLLVPTIFDADTKSVAQIATESRILAQLARDGKISPAQLAGGTFTASNLGMFGIEAFTAIINPPQVAILAAGAIERAPVIVGDTVAARWQMAATLTCDHRVLYGAQAAQFLGDIKRHLEHPALLL
jgi:pyruvate dehydrogenase E2 component (dihydrolipoamide acetyltransferase)